MVHSTWTNLLAAILGLLCFREGIEWSELTVKKICFQKLPTYTPSYSTSSIAAGFGSLRNCGCSSNMWLKRRLPAARTG